MPRIVSGFSSSQTRKAFTAIATSTLSYPKHRQTMNPLETCSTHCMSYSHALRTKRNRKKDKKINPDDTYGSPPCDRGTAPSPWLARGTVPPRLRWLASLGHLLACVDGRLACRLLFRTPGKEEKT